MLLAGAADAVAPVGPPHEVHEVVAGRQRGAAQHQVVGSPAQHPATRPHLDDRPGVVALLHEADLAVVGLAVAAGTHDRGAHPHLLDGHLAVGRLHERAGREALV